MPIHDDVKVGDVEAVARQLDEGAEVDKRDEREGLTPLMTAVTGESIDVDVVLLLIERGADVNAFESEEGENVLTLI